MEIIKKMNFKTNVLLLIIFVCLMISCKKSSEYNYTGKSLGISDTLYYPNDIIHKKNQNIYNCVQISPVKTFGLFVNLEIPLDIYVEGISDSLLEVTTDNGIISKKGNLFYIKTEKEGSTIITLCKDGNIISQKYFSAIQLPQPEPRLGNFVGKDISKNDLLSIPGLWAKMPDYCDYYSATIESFSIVAYLNGIEKTLISEDNRFTEEQINFFKELNTGQAIYFENIISKTEDGNEHELEILKIVIL